ncbi:MAG: NAD-binding protein [Lentisphaeria bacterium]|nr:3-hydroxyacyl-CoA dehydrogenase NAD-binding domain-containing protein [Lentisphaeria bacterium]NQZ69738.1 NAD-binding protein [Lentisphaeria bacterium]
MYKQIAILGAGTIGSSWASFFASKGLDVRVFDNDLKTRKKAEEHINEQLTAMHENGLITDDAFAKSQISYHIVDTLDTLLDGADYIQESVIEDYAIKDLVYREIESLIGAETIIASSSSGLLITKMQEALAKPGRSLIAHPFNPPHLIPLVELVAGEKTEPSTISDVKGFFEALGKTPVVLNKEVPGHIANRLAAALWREALALVDNDVASVEDVDKALSAGPGLRWALMGQHMIYDLNGGEGGYENFITGIGASFSEYWKTMDDWTEIPDSAKEKAVAGIADFYTDKTQADWLEWRDDKLMKILKILNE